jgi:hypothetical protein
VTEPKIVQSDFSAGMFRGVDPSKIPARGASDIVGLLTADGSVRQRGGAGWASASGHVVDGLDGVWSGELATGPRTVLLRAGGVSRLNDDGTITSLDASGVTRARPAVYKGKLYWNAGDYDGTTVGAGLASGLGNHFAVVAGRLLRVYQATDGVRVDFTAAGGTSFGATDFHLIGGGAELVGVYPLRDALAVFTSIGLFVISGLGLNLTDADGNIQHRVDLYSDDVVLQGSSWGVCGYGSGLVVPARDGVWTVSLGVTSEAALPLRKISGPIDGLWQSADVSYDGGQAEVVNGQYLIPISVPGFVEPRESEVLACRLDAERPSWSRLTGQGANVRAVGTWVTETLQERFLVAGAFEDGFRLLGLAWFREDLMLDPDATASPARVVTRDLALGSLNANTAVKVRVGYELEDGAVTAEASTAVGDAVGWAFDPGAPLDVLAGSGDESSETFSFPIGKRGRFVRVAVEVADVLHPGLIRTIEVFTRAGGRQ